MTRKPAQLDAGYEQHKEAARSRQAAQSRAGRDLGEIPAVENPERRAKCERDFRAFCESYFAPSFSLAWSKDHLTVIARIEQAVLHGGLFALAMPRSSGKTTLCETACVWAVVCGHRTFVALIGAESKHASEMLEAIKTELETNDLLIADFPEVCYPIARLEGIANRCKGQLYQGEQTRITWTQDQIILPTIAGSRASGSILKVAGITGRIRGMKHKRADGTPIRPDLVIVDDPQTDESARSRTQCQAREGILAGAVLGLAGPDKRIAGVMPCTVITPGDMADSILNRSKHPDWMGERMRLVYRWPDREDLWQRYGEMRADGLRAGDDGQAAHEFYLANREDMDRGSDVAWPERHKPNEASAIQSAWNIRLMNEAAFMAEYQNDPLPLVRDDVSELTADEIASKVNGIDRGTVPMQAVRLTGMIDVQGSALFWLVAAWEDDFTGSVVDYGCYPDQGRAYFTLRDVQRTLGDVHPGGLESAIYAGLTTLVEHLAGRPWSQDGGSQLSIERLLIDANWGDSTDVVYQFCRQSKHTAALTPSHGRGIGAGNAPMRDWQKKPGERTGPNWRISQAQGRAVRHCTFDSNFWKSFTHTRLSIGLGGRGCLSLPGTSAAKHRLLADHLTAEYRVRTEGRGRQVDEWKLRPDRPDNHWLDCYDEETDVLTRDGWMRFANLTGGEELATVDLATDAIEYQRPTRLIARHHAGEMVKIGGERMSRLDLLVTPNHRMVIFASQASKGPVVREACDLTIWDKIKTSATWQGDGRTTYTIPASATRKDPSAVCGHCGIKKAGRARQLCWGCYYTPGVKEQHQKATPRRGHDEVTVCAKDLAAFLGWYVSEGSCRINTAPGKGKTYVVTISQMPGAKRAAICDLLDRLPWKYHAVKGGLTISNEQAYRLVCGLGNKYTKHVPQWIKDAGPDVISEFIRCAVDGDGWRCRTGEAYATVSARLADDMMELYLKAGYAVSSRLVPPKRYDIRGHSAGAERCHEQYHVHRKTTDRCQLRDSRNKPNFGPVHYEGMVYCATVPNGTLIVRRNGKVAICGNCLSGATVAASIQGCTLAEMQQATAAKKRVKFSEIQRQRRGTR